MKENVMKKFISKFSMNHSNLDMEDIAQPFDQIEYDDSEMRENTTYRNEDMPVKKNAFIPDINNATNDNGFLDSIIAEGLIIHGSVVSSSNIKILGTIDGDVTADGDIVLCGKVNGNIRGLNITLNNAEVTGNIVAGACVVQNKNSFIKGNISASQLDISGVVNGDVKVSESIAIRNTAQITGNIETKLISVFDGAIINSQININTNK